MARVRKAQGTKAAPEFGAEGTYLVGYSVSVAGGRTVKRAGQGTYRKGKVEQRDTLVSVTEHEARGLAERIRSALAGVVRDSCASTLFGPVTDAAGLATVRQRWAEHEARADKFNARPEARSEGVTLAVRFGVKPLGLTAAEATERAVVGLQAIHEACRAGEAGGVVSALQTHENVPRLLPAGVLRQGAEAAVNEAREARKQLAQGLKASGGKALPATLGKGLLLVELEAALAMLAAPVDGAGADPEATAPPPDVARGVADPEPTAPLPLAA